MPHDSEKGNWARVGLGIKYRTISEVQGYYRDKTMPGDPDEENTLPYMFDGCDYEAICIV
jgi:hypothetical protein